MGFFDKLAKSFVGKKESDLARPADSRSYPGSERFNQPKAPRPVPVPAKVDRGFSQKPAPAPVGTAVAVVEPPEVATVVAVAEPPEVATVVAVAEPPEVAMVLAVAEPPEVATAAAVAEPPQAATVVAETVHPEIVETHEAQVTSPADLTGENLFTEDFDQDLNDAFDSLVTQALPPEGQSANAEMSSSDQAVVEDLFADIAANYARPVKNFIFELKRGTATKDWIDICRPAMQGIRRSAEGMGLKVAAQRMVDVETALSLAQGSEQRVLGGEIRELLLSCYEDLIKVMPQAFVVGEEEQQREGIIINALLMQIPNMGHVTVEKLYRAGLTSLETLFLAQKDDLAAATGIHAAMSERICEKFRSYRAELEGNSRDLGISGQRTRLSDMLAELRRQHEGLELATENEWSNPALASEKREYRQQRQSCSLRINVLLAEMGELDLVNELQKLSFERRIQRLEEYLATPYATA
jgi:hypothetical protein